MASVLFRTGSGPINSSLLPGSPRFSVPVRHGSFSGCEKFEFSPLLHLEVNNHQRIRRAISEPRTISRLKSVNAGSQTFPEMLPEMEEESFPDEDVVIGCIGSLKFAEKCFDRMSAIPASGLASEEAQSPGFGSGSGRDRDGYGSGRSSNGGNNSNDRSKIGAHYQKLLESNPNDPLILRNYGKFLHEIEGNTVKAEEYYGRAILASPEDGELLSLYGKLIWDAQRDGERAQYYFDQAINASPDDCMVMGSYAQFMWEAEEDENVEEEFGSKDDYFQVDNSAIKHDGFFVNRGKLERINEPTALPSEQPKKRRRKDSTKGVDGSKPGHVPNKQMKVNKNEKKKMMLSADENPNTPSRSITVPTVNNVDVKYQNTVIALGTVVKKHSDYKNMTNPSPTTNILNAEARVTAKNIDKQKTGVLQSKKHGSKTKDGSQTPVHQRTNDKGADVLKSQRQLLRNSEDLNQSVLPREKYTVHQQADIKASEIAQQPVNIFSHLDASLM